MSLLGPQRYALARALAMVRDRPFAFLLGVVLVASALALPLATASIAWAARPALVNVQPAPEISVFLSTRAGTRDVEGLKGRLARVEGVASVELRSRDAAFEQLIRKSGFTAPPSELGPNPLPDVLIAKLRAPVSQKTLDAIVADVRGWPLVDVVRSDVEWYRKLEALGGLLTTAIAVFGGLVVLLVALILIGTVRLHAGTRADEVAVLKLVGAAPRFIVRPYAYSAALTLLLAAGLAIGGVYLAHAALRGPIANLTALYGAPFQLPNPEPFQLAAVVAGAVVFGWLVGLAGARAVISSR